MNTDFSTAPMVRISPRPTAYGLGSPETLSPSLTSELEKAKEIDSGWLSQFEDSRLLAGACDVKTAQRLAARAPSPFLSGWLAAMVTQMMMSR